MKAVRAALLSLLLAGCASAPPPPPPVEPLLRDALFTAPQEAVDVAAVMRLSPAMQQYLAQAIEPRVRSKGPQHALLDALYTRGELRLEYDAALTRNASEAFDARSGNCLSLVIMTAALARELGLEVRYQSVAVDPTWERNGDLFLAIGHVNLSLGQTATSLRQSGYSEWLTVDFLPGQDLKRQRTRPIGEGRVLAMYLNNKAAEALAAARLDPAYAWVRAALRQDPGFAAAANTLGVVYLRRGALAEAERALRHALAVEPEHTSAMGNLAQVLRRQGREGDAVAMEQALLRVQPVAPFASYMQGREAYRLGDFKTARELFEREIARGADNHETHFWLALTFLQLGQARPATEHLKIALESSTTGQQQALYASKLEQLRRQGLH